MQFRLGELFCGSGGLAYGALHAKIELADFKIVHAWSNDCDVATCETYRHNICPNDPQSVICKDVRELDFSQLAPIDALAFGFPCNDFSLIGERRGFDGKYGSLYTYGVKALKYFQPLWFVAENVSGLRSTNEGKALKIILQDLKNAGYRLSVNLYKFEDYGIPQARHRVIIVGIRDDLNFEFKIPSPLLYNLNFSKCVL